MARIMNGRGIIWKYSYIEGWYNNKRIHSVVWEFFKSDITGRVGATKQLLDFLTANGIDYVIH